MKKIIILSLLLLGISAPIFAETDKELVELTGVQHQMTGGEDCGSKMVGELEERETHLGQSESVTDEN